MESVMVIRFIPPNSPPQFNKIVQMESGEGNGRSEQKYKCYFATKVSLYCALKHKIMSQQSHYKSKIKTTELKLLDSLLLHCITIEDNTSERGSWLLLRWGWGWGGCSRSRQLPTKIEIQSRREKQFGWQ